MGSQTETMAQERTAHKKYPLFSITVLAILCFQCTLAGPIKEDGCWETGNPCYGQAGHLYPSPVACEDFRKCENNVEIECVCPDGLWWDEEAGVCNYAYNVNCTLNDSTLPPSTTTTILTTNTNTTPTTTTTTTTT